MDIIGDLTLLDLAFQYSLYLRECRLPSGGIGKVNLFLTVRSEDDHIRFDALDVVTIYRHIDVKEYGALSASDKNKNGNELIRSSLVAVFGNDPQAVEIVNNIHVSIEKNDFSKEAYWGKAVQSPNKALKAQIFYSLSHKLDVYLHVFNRKGDRIRSKLLWSLRPQYIDFGSLIWSGDSELRLYEKIIDRRSVNADINNRDYWSYDIERDILEFYFHRAETGQAHGQYDLAMMYWKGWEKHPADREKALYWMRKSADQGFGRAVKMLGSIHE